ncbi:MAG: MerR family DNA-binding transcriptional regulator [Rhodospirillales bacterium]|nr:MerR family DNA-binding transcriptional regulator [Rhodospirillales bacterium]MCW8861381.1 MerR family DNA-binding transcriptional regulator [Rhodospirillales bacterium]MCW8952276.1 MerR family DNA-binding transcriptional regulator [Rhodospirillales bacterium]MCW8971422.1 MerR family DNA-binding transcriptional regulator [Rhodospirillales bacterium]MCW9001250.1 MerR family DNA-binding transcriptional regulator [Rhodospirillales bacterium]
MEKLYSVTELAAELDITPRAIRFYETKGLLSPQRAGTTRVYTHRDRARLLIILRAKRMGFSLADVAEYLSLYDMDTSKVSQMKMLLQRVNSRIADLESQRLDLDTTIDELREVQNLTLQALNNREKKTARA